MIEIKERQTAAFLKSKILEVLQSYGVTVDQIFSVTVDNGANMLAAVKKLKQELEFLAAQQMLTVDDIDRIEPADETKEESDTEIDCKTETETAASDERSREITEALSIEFQEQLNLIRCSVHTLQLAVLDVVDKSDESVKQITAIAKKCKGIKYKILFDSQNAKYPPVWSPTRWGGIFKMLQSFRQQKDFFVQLALQFTELVAHGGHYSYLYLLSYRRERWHAASQSPIHSRLQSILTGSAFEGNRRHSSGFPGGTGTTEASTRSICQKSRWKEALKRPSTGAATSTRATRSSTVDCMNVPLLPSPDIKISKSPSEHNLVEMTRSRLNISTTSLSSVHRKLLKKDVSCNSLAPPKSVPLLGSQPPSDLRETVLALTNSTHAVEPIKPQNRLRNCASVATCSRCSSLLSLAAAGSRYSLNGGFVSVGGAGSGKHVSSLLRLTKTSSGTSSSSSSLTVRRKMSNKK